MLKKAIISKIILGSLLTSNLFGASSQIHAMKSPSIWNGDLNSEFTEGETRLEPVFLADVGLYLPRQALPNFNMVNKKANMVSNSFIHLTDLSNLREMFSEDIESQIKKDKIFHPNSNAVALNGMELIHLSSEFIEIENKENSPPIITIKEEMKTRFEEFVNFLVNNNISNLRFNYIIFENHNCNNLKCLCFLEKLKEKYKEIAIKKEKEKKYLYTYISQIILSSYQDYNEFSFLEPDPDNYIYNNDTDEIIDNRKKR